ESFQRPDAPESASAADRKGEHRAVFRQHSTPRNGRSMLIDLTADQADALILRAYEKGIIGAHQLPKVLHEWRNPTHEDFAVRTAWSLFNAVTAAMRDYAVSQPHSFAVQTMRLNGLLDFRPETGKA